MIQRTWINTVTGLLPLVSSVVFLISSILRCLRIATGTMSWDHHTKEDVSVDFPTGQSSGGSYSA